MDLLQHIKSDRAQRKKKQNLRPTLFDRIGGLVKEYGLGESFLRKVESPDDFLLEKNIEFARVRKKQPSDIELFVLAEEEEYRLTMAIIHKLDNKYLEFAQSPNEIAISRPLFDLNPSLGADKLERYHFETLLLCERAKKELRSLATPDRNVRRRKDTGLEKESREDECSLPDSSAKRLEQLQSFIDRVEESQS
jgi:hypothetical protein